MVSAPLPERRAECGRACYARTGAGWETLLGDATVPDYRHRSAGGKAPHQRGQGDTPLHITLLVKYNVLYFIKEIRSKTGGQ